MQIVDITIPVEADVAEALASLAPREELGRLISETLRPRESYGPLAVAMDRLAAEAKRRRLTQEILHEELAVWKKERRDSAATDR